MHDQLKPLTAFPLFIITLVLAFASISKAADPPTTNPSLPTIFIAGDSTAQPGNPNAVGWGKPFLAFFDPAKINIVNNARGGRSSRTYVTEGIWDTMIAKVRPGDFVLIQFGQNDGGPIDKPPYRASLPGLGEETGPVTRPSTQPETIHTFGWYMRKMVDDVKAKGATPILFSLTVRNLWKDGHVERGSSKYGEWTKDVAQSEGAAFVDLTNMVADLYEKMGADDVKKLFPRDFVHTGANGAEINAEYVLSGIKALHENGIVNTLSAAGRAIPMAAPNFIMDAKLPVPRNVSDELWFRWLNLPEVQDPALPTIFLIGDSTVRNGRGDGVDGQWGWGDALSAWIDPTKANLVNRAVGGTGARTFMNSRGYWDKVLAMLKPGDTVIMQFGTNDNGPVGALKGIGEETEDRVTGTQHETVHTFGWYLRKYIADTRAKGATPIVCTLVPRNSWDGDKITRTKDTQADWARETAQSENAPLLDLYETLAAKYDTLGKDRTTDLFADKRVHTNRDGAAFIANTVIEDLQQLPDKPFAKFIEPAPSANW